MNGKVSFREHLMLVAEIEYTLEFWKKEFHKMANDLWICQKECKEWKDKYELLVAATGYDRVDVLVKAWWERQE